MKSLFVELYDLDTYELVGNGTWSGSLAAKSLLPINVPVTFSYQGVNASDATCEFGFLDGFPA